MWNLCCGSWNLVIVILKWTWSMEGPLFIYFGWTIQGLEHKFLKCFVDLYLFIISSGSVQLLSFIPATILFPSWLVHPVSLQIMSRLDQFMPHDLHPMPTQKVVRSFYTEVEFTGWWQVFNRTDFHALQVQCFVTLQGNCRVGNPILNSSCSHVVHMTWARPYTWCV